jgi:hypothetical protein
MDEALDELIGMPWIIEKVHLGQTPWPIDNAHIRQLISFIH